MATTYNTANLTDTQRLFMGLAPTGFGNFSGPTGATSSGTIDPNTGLPPTTGAGLGSSIAQAPQPVIGSVPAAQNTRAINPNDYAAPTEPNAAAKQALLAARSDSAAGTRSEGWTAPGTGALTTGGKEAATVTKAGATTAATTPAATASSAKPSNVPVVADSRVFSVGQIGGKWYAIGYNGQSMAPLNSDGTLGSWVQGPSRTGATVNNQYVNERPPTYSDNLGTAAPDAGCGVSTWGVSGSTPSEFTGVTRDEYGRLDKDYSMARFCGQASPRYGSNWQSHTTLNSDTTAPASGTGGVGLTHTGEIYADYTNFFNYATPGSTRQWANGTITLSADGQNATYKDASGKTVSFGKNTPLEQVAALHPDIAKHWDNVYGTSFATGGGTGSAASTGGTTGTTGGTTGGSTGGSSVNPATHMVNSIFLNRVTGQATDWAGGSLTVLPDRMTAVWKSPEGISYSFTPDTSLDVIASMHPNIANLLNRTYGTQYYTGDSTANTWSQYQSNVSQGNPYVAYYQARTQQPAASGLSASSYGLSSYNQNGLY